MKTQTFLQLAPEMGGLRFGPFEGAIQIGSDPKRNQLVLDRSHGIFPAHASIVQTADDVYTIGPVQQGCQVFVVPQGQQQVWPVHAPVQARAGDVVIFGTPAGPRFQILAVVKDQRTAGQIANDAARTGGEQGFVQGVGSFLDRFFGPPTQKGIAGEVQRQARAKMLTRSPFREVYAIYTRVRHGSLTSPYFIVSAMGAVLTMIIGGTVSCSGLFYTLYNALMR